MNTMLFFLALQAPAQQSGAPYALERALAEWELAAATQASEPEALRRIRDLETQAEALAEAHPSDVRIAASAAAIVAAHTEFCAAHGQSSDVRGSAQQDTDSDNTRDETEIIAQIVMGHLGGRSEEASKTILALGARAVPTLVALARRLKPTEMQAVVVNALQLLVQIDPQRFMEVAHELAVEPSVLVRQTLCQILTKEGSATFSRPEFWEAAPGLGWRPRNTLLAELLERLFAEPSLNPTQLSALAVHLVRLGWIPPGLLEAVEDFPDYFWTQLESHARGSLPVFHAGLALSWTAENPAAEHQITQGLIKLAEPSALLSWVNDPSRARRRLLAVALQRSRNVYVGSNFGSSAKIERIPQTLTPELCAALCTLLRDPDASVSETALSSALGHWQSQRDGAEVDANALLAAVRAIESEALRLQFWENSAWFRDASDVTCVDPLILEEMLAEPSPKVVNALTALWGLELSDTDRVRIIARIGAGQSDWALSDRARPTAAQPRDVQPWLTLLQNEQHSGVARFTAAAWAIHPDSVGGAQYPALLDFVVRAIAEIDGITDQWARMRINVDYLYKRLEAAGRAPSDLYLAALADPEFPEERVKWLPFPDTSNAERSAQLIDAVFRRLPPGHPAWKDDNGQLMSRVVAASRQLPVEAALPILRAGVGVATSSVFHEVRERREPALLDFLRQRFEARDTPLTLLANTAAAFLSEDAAKLILDIAAETTDRKACAEVLAALEQVSTYMEARARWEQRRDATVVRARAIAELVAISADAAGHSLEQRAEALRGLGLLGAVEELPLLVRFLADPSPALAEAARAALADLRAK